LPVYAADFEELLQFFFTDVGVDGLFCDQPDIAVKVRDRTMLAP
jgi:glycerophosphoryl diester phosphodiesterase